MLKGEDVKKVILEFCCSENTVGGIMGSQRAA